MAQPMTVLNNADLQNQVLDLQTQLSEARTKIRKLEIQVSSLTSAIALKSEDYPLDAIYARELRDAEDFLVNVTNGKHRSRQIVFPEIEPQNVPAPVQAEVESYDVEQINDLKGKKQTIIEKPKSKARGRKPSKPVREAMVLEPEATSPMEASTPDSKKRGTKKRTRQAVLVPEMNVDDHLLPLGPCYVAPFVVHSLGSISTDKGFHNKRYIYPIGYRVSRQYASTIHPVEQTIYHSMILKEKTGPLFRIEAEDRPGFYFDGLSPSQCWNGVIREANRIRGKSTTHSACGHENFGFSCGVIVFWLQRLPNVEKLTKYVFQPIQVVNNTGKVDAYARLAMFNPNATKVVLPLNVPGTAESSGTDSGSEMTGSVSESD